EPPTLDNIVALIESSTNAADLHYQISSCAQRDVREAILASTLSTGADPLTIVPPHHTLGALWIVSARLHIPSAPPVPPDYIGALCASLNREHAQLAHERVSMLTSGISSLSLQLDNPAWALMPLRDLVYRFPPSPSCITTVHPFYMMAVHRSKSYSHARGLLLDHPIEYLDTTLCPELSHTDCLNYFYLAGIALTLLSMSHRKQYLQQALAYFEACITYPGTAVSAVQLEALKKMTLIELFMYGKTTPLPKYTHPQLLKLFKGTPYYHFSAGYPGAPHLCREIAEKEHQMFNEDKNASLVELALDALPKWALQRLTHTYVTFSLEDIAEAIQLPDGEVVREMVLEMIAAGEVHAVISGDGTVSFTDALTQVSRQQVDAMLLRAQRQSDALAVIDARIGRSREFLTKVRA
ncbi:hypothetical protein FISHEDRAFT_23327, partial [Fistulina hepatica ATCC 64428]